MKIIVCKNYEEMSKKAAMVVKDVIGRYYRPKLGLATGSSPEGLYKELVKMYESNDINFLNAETVNLDEYVGIDPENPQSYHYYMQKNFFDKINIRKENIHIPSGSEDKLDEAVRDYNEKLDYVGRRDIQILGIGENGHIAFNEPAFKLNLRTSIVELTEDTVKANSRFFENEEDVPKRAISMGIKDILNAEVILILASGAKKQKAVKELIEGDRLDTKFPASMLHIHNNVVLVIDEDAYGLVGK
ncbi:glucosamine-6-phosphate deaminase [Microaceticoccus formicicus]|uniref:glucosamine-6-phosphate deaminase n=1 Tax=Microaceticoccus formicicus TaxID=3118105 RepID=UPI003CD02F6D|nr:glucosamine-6-phosphate deaminase [Peptoniphilaceae bacterium AMB_02]